MENKYYIENNDQYNNKQVNLIKKNNYYVARAFNALLRSINDPTADIGGVFRSALISGLLPKNDKQTGMDTNGLAEKLKFLTIAISDKNHPENMEKFKNSYLVKNILMPFFIGYVEDADEQWNNFQRTFDFEVTFKEKGSLEGALYCNKEDLSSPLGFDYSKLIDAIVKTDKDGNYYLDPTNSIEDEVAMSKALSAELRMLKSNERFRSNYENKVLDYEYDDEDELN